MKEGVEDSRRGLSERGVEGVGGVVLVLKLEKKKNVEVDGRELGRSRDLEREREEEGGKERAKRAYLYPLPNWESSK